MSKWLHLLKEPVAVPDANSANSANRSTERNHNDINTRCGVAIGTIGTNDRWQDVEDHYAERAALIEYGSGVPREWAEAFATLDQATPPKDMHPHRWHQIINDGGQFLDEWGGKALALGWRAVDVFGLSRTGPSARFDGMGLVACLRGRPVVAISDRSARIATDHGYQTFHRTPMGESIAIWDLKIK
jgi:hypothetical protein